MGGLDKQAENIEIRVMSEWKISGISALVITHCEYLSEKERGEIINLSNSKRIIHRLLSLWANEFLQ